MAGSKASEEPNVDMSIASIEGNGLFDGGFT